MLPLSRPVSHKFHTIEQRTKTINWAVDLEINLASFLCFLDPSSLVKGSIHRLIPELKERCLIFLIILKFIEDKLLQDTVAFVARKDSWSLGPHYKCHLQYSKKYQR